jgi:hypothetical protein
LVGFPSHRRLPAGILAAAAIRLVLEGPLAIAAAGEPTDAEYAIRWNARDGGPKSGAEVLAVLSVHARHTSDYRIDYYGLPPAATAPPGFATILRRRTENAGRSALTWKLRGDHALAEWACPLRKSRNAKAEVDVAFGGADTVTRKYSYSCTTDSPDVAASELSAERKACTSVVRRWDAGRLKVEEWRLPGDVLMIEVSGGGTNTPAATEQFRKRVAVPLLAAGIVPLVDSKTELGSRCP